MRHFVKTVGLCLLLADNSAQALSIGGIRVKSALNQRFNADIVLSLNAGDDANAIHVQLAPFDKFSEHGVPWDRELLKLRFETVQSNGHSVVIRVKSSGIISEPILVFLLQASSPKGTIYRQFTVLLDPPTNYEPVQISRQVEPEIMAPKRHYAPQSGFYSSPHERKTPISAVLRTKPSNPVPEVKRKPEWVGVHSNDSLSKIAKRLKGGVSPEQMALALYHANPKAFFSPNINALKAGQTLRVPERKAIRNLSVGEAKTEFYRQNRAWKEQLSIPAPPLEPKVEAPSVAETPAPTTPRKLTLSAPTESLATPFTLLADDTADLVIKSVDSVDVLSEKVQSLQERLNRMEQQMTSMQKLILVKDEQLAHLQNSQTTADQNGRVSHFLNAITGYFKIESKNLFYVCVGFAELIALGLLSFHGSRKFRAKKAKSE